MPRDGRRVMDFLPAIDLRGGRCVRLHQGDFAKETVYSDDPVAVAKAYEAAGAPWIHVVDLDAARGQGSNRDIATAIAAAVGVPVQAGGGVRDDSLLDAGFARIVFGSVAMSDPDAVVRAIERHGTRVAVGLDHWQGEIKVRGWEQGTGEQLVDVVRRFESAGVGAFVVTDITRDGMLVGPDVDGYRALVEATPVPVVASGGVGSLDDLCVLRDTGVAGVIVGRALYEGRFTVEEAVAACAP
ncbi:MAG TPA: 1-(5-phosphoribosyl)-5-[(5-phosphoribosylamino)methylideneamino]imidazole-4-carboxamide isomerase [Acidimicrobiales bacterium]